MRRVDEGTGEEVPYDKIVSGYEVEKGQYIEFTDDELEASALESTRTIDIDEFVPKKEIDQLYNIRPYYIVPEGKVGIDAFAVIRDAIEEAEKVALGRVVLTNREHVIALEPRGKGLMGTLLRYPYEVRNEDEYFDEIPQGKATKDMLDLAKHIVQTKSGHFNPDKFEDHYEEALKELLNKKQAGQDRSSKGTEAHECSQSDGCPSQKCGGSGWGGGYFKACCTDSEDRKENLSRTDEAEEGRIMSFTAASTPQAVPLFRERFSRAMLLLRPAL